MRSVEEAAGQLAAAERAGPNAASRRSRSFYAGVTGALRWVVEASPMTPLTEQAAVADLPGIRREIRAAHRMMGGQSEFDYSFVGGVEHALVWMSGDSDMPPCPSDEELRRLLE